MALLLLLGKERKGKERKGKEKKKEQPGKEKGRTAQKKKKKKEHKSDQYMVVAVASSLFSNVLPLSCLAMK